MLRCVDLRSVIRYKKKADDIASFSSGVICLIVQMPQCFGVTFFG